MLINEKRYNVPSSLLKNRKIIMYGASTRNITAINALHIYDNVSFFVDRDAQKVGQELDGFAIRSVDSLSECTDCLVLSVLVSCYMEIVEIVQDKGIESCLFYYSECFNIRNAFNSNWNVLQHAKKFRYIHVFSNDKFVMPFYQMLEERFCIREHLLILAYRIKDDYANVLQFVLEKSRKYQNVLILDDIHGIQRIDSKDSERLIPSELDCNKFFYSAGMKEIFRYADRIILHSALWGYETKKLTCALTKTYAEKIFWVCYGADAYFDKNSFEVTQILSKIRFCPGSNGVYEVVKQNYGIYRKIDGEAYYVYVPKHMIKQVPIHDSVNILLGHSAAKYGNHMEGLEILKKYVDEDIKIYCPLSYGSESYRKEVIQKGKAMFGNKFIPLLSYMEQVQYLEFLQSIDVAVFPLKRLGAESTFLLLRAFHVKIYADIGVTKHISDRLLHIEDIRKIQSETLEEFIASIKQESYGISDLNNYVVDEWTRILEVR